MLRVIKDSMLSWIEHYIGYIVYARSPALKAERDTPY
jgi:hypothetical protein